MENKNAGTLSLAVYEVLHKSICEKELKKRVRHVKIGYQRST